MAEAKTVPKDVEAGLAAPPPQPFYPNQAGYQVPGAVGYQQIPQQHPGTYVIQQPMYGAQVPVAAGQSSMILVGQQQPQPQTYQMTQPMVQPQIQTATLIKQPVSVAFGAPLIHPGMPKPMVMQQVAPPGPIAPPPYPGPPADVKYDVAGAPKNIYEK